MLLVTSRKKGEPIAGGGRTEIEEAVTSGQVQETGRTS